MDLIKLYKLFFQFIQEPPPPKEFYSSDEHQVNIRCWELRIWESKDQYVSDYAQIRRLERELKRLNYYMDVPSAGGTIYVNEDEEKSYEILEQIKGFYKDCERSLGFIQMYEEAILEERDKIQEKENQKRIREWEYRHWRQKKIDAPISGTQTKLEFV